MRRPIFVCVVSAGIGALLSLWLAKGLPSPGLRGQEPSPDRFGSGTLAAPPRAPGVADTEPAAVADDAGWGDFTAEERVNISVYDKANRGVVHIMTKATSPDSFFALEVPAEGSGSGSVLDRRGNILTNYHVVEGAKEIRVTLFNGETYDAQLIGRDPANDIAVLRIEATPEVLFPIELGDSSRLRVGQRVFAIGNPFGLERTLTVGTLSSLNRRLPSRTGREMKSIIQVDAALNRGNSGGPLLGSRGLLIGMNTAIASSTGENTGVGFAIPVNTINRVVPQLIEQGRVIRPVIGIESVYETDHGLVIIRLVREGRPSAPACAVSASSANGGGLLFASTLTASMRM